MVLAMQQTLALELISTKNMIFNRTKTTIVMNLGEVQEKETPYLGQFLILLLYSESENS